MKFGADAWAIIDQFLFGILENNKSTEIGNSFVKIKLDNLWPHQKEIYEFGVDKDAVFCTSSPGVGKSLPHAKIAEDAIKNKKSSRVLIICPKTLMRTTWYHEFNNYTSLTLNLAEAPEKNRLAAFASKSDVVIINIDAVVWMMKQGERWIKKVLGSNAMLIIDESTAFKNPNSLRTKAMIKLSKYFTRRFLLSGTPAPNTITEIWPQVFILDQGARLGKRYTAFRNMMQSPINKGPFVTWVDKPDAAIITYGMIRDIVIHHEFDDVMTLVPELKHQIMKYDLSEKHYEVYKEFEKEAFLEIKDKTITAVNAGSLANKLLQLASGAMYSGDKEWIVFDRGRYELIADLVEQRQHTVVFFHWFHQRMVLEEEFTSRKLKYAVIDGTVKSTTKRSDIIEEFQNGEYNVILLQPLSAAHGVTLTQADTVIWASPTYQGDIYNQGIARIKRGVQRKHTQSIIIVGSGTKDEHCYEVFMGKKQKIEALNELFHQGLGG